MTETDLSKLIQFSIGVQFKERNFVWKFHASEYDPVGIPDIIGSIEGFFVGIEAKLDTNRFSDAQKAKIRAINRTGGIAAGIVGAKDGSAAWWLDEEEVTNFSLRRRENWILLPFYAWRDTLGKTHKVLNLAPLRVEIHNRKTEFKEKK
jgi:ribosomal protein L25 (general stress protein Ctc)